MSTAAKDAPNLTAIQYKTGSAPSTPASGYVRTFVDSADGKVKLIDSTGAITPVGNATSLVFATDFGVTDDGGTTDQHTALQAAIDACASGDPALQYQAKTLVLPPYRVRVSAALHATNLSGFVLQGAGGLSTINSHVSGPWLLVESCSNCVFRDFNVVCEAPCATVFQQYALASGALVTATGNLWENIYINSGGTNADRGWLLDGGSGQNNDFTTWINCKGAPFGVAAWDCRGFECYSNLWINCGGTGAGASTTAAGLHLEAATGTWIGGALNSAAAAIEIVNSDAGGGLTVRGLVSEQCARLVDATGSFYSLTLDHVRWTGSVLAADGKFLKLPGGKVTISQCELGLGHTLSTPALQIDWDGGYRGLRLAQNTFYTTDPAGLAASLFPTEPASDLQDNFVGSGLDPTLAAWLPNTWRGAFTANSTSPTVKGHVRLYQTANTADTAITGFTQNTTSAPWRPNQEIEIDIADDHTTFAPSSTLRPPGNRALAPRSGDTVTFRYDATAGLWRATGSAGYVAPGAFTPNAVGGLLFWLHAGDLALSDNDPVGTWANSAYGGGYTFTAAGSARPTYKATAGPNSSPTVQFNGTAQWMSSTPDLTNSALTFYAVVSRSAVGSAFEGILNSYAYLFGGRMNSFNHWGIYDNNEEVDSGVTLSSTPLLLEAVCTAPTHIDLWTNGGSHVTDTAGASLSTNGGLRLGAGIADGTQLLAGQITDLAVFVGAHDTVTRQAIESYFHTLYPALW